MRDSLDMMVRNGGDYDVAVTSPACIGWLDKIAVGHANQESKPGQLRLRGAGQGAVGTQTR